MAKTTTVTDVYELILSAKDFVQNQLDNGGFEHVSALAGADDQLHAKILGLCVQRAQEKGGINTAAALATVLAVGDFVGWQRTFMMPATKDCCGAFRDIRNSLSRGRGVSLSYYEGGNLEPPVYYRALGPGQRAWVIQAARLNRNRA